MSKLHPRYVILLACLTAALGVLVVYLPGLPGDFMFDDIGNILLNSPLALHDLSPHSLLRALLSDPGGGSLRPLSMLSFGFNIYFFGMSPLAFKVVNITIHIACGVMLGLVSRELLRAYAYGYKREIPPATVAWLSLAAAALWALHPINLSPVLYVVQRETSLATLCSAAAVLAYLTGRRRQREGGTGRSQLWLLTPLLILLGILCKENAALVPGYLLAIEFCLLDFRGCQRRFDRDVLGFFAVFLLLPGLALLGLIVVDPAALFGTYAGRDYTLYQRLLSEARILWDYLRWILIPDPNQLGLFHDDIVPSRGLLDPVSTLPACLGILGLIAGALWARHRLPLLSVGLLWFFVGHVMESSVLPLELAFEHRNYMPVFGIIFGVVTTAYLLCVQHGLTRLVTTLIVLFLLLFAGITALRAASWQNELSFARTESAHHPDSPRALAEMQWAYTNYIITTKDTSLVPEAIRAAERSKAADGHSINQDVGLAFMFARLDDMPNAARYLDAAGDDAKTAHSSSTLQFALQTLMDMAEPKNQALYPGIVQVFRNALANPRLRPTRCYTANIWNSYAIFQEEVSAIPDALAGMHQAVTLCSRNPQLVANYTRMLLVMRDAKDAEPQLEALRALHDIRWAAELDELQGDYDRLTTAPTK